MKCSKCGNSSKMERFETDDDFKIIDVERSESNWDDWDTCVKVECKECGYIFELVE